MILKVDVDSLLYITGGIRTYLRWSCKPDFNVHDKCAGLANDSCWKHYLYRGRPHHDSYQMPTESLKFNLVPQHPPDGLINFFYGDENYKSGPKYFRCRGQVETDGQRGFHGPVDVPAPLPLNNLSPQSNNGKGVIYLLFSFIVFISVLFKHTVSLCICSFFMELI